MKSNLPEGWKEVKLKDVVKIISGGTPKRKEASYWNGDIPWISVKDFPGDGKYIEETDEKITRKGLDNSSTNMLDSNDIIISARGTVGKLGIVKYPMAFNQSCYGLRSNELLLNNDYFYYFLKYDMERLKKRGHGSVFNTIIRATLEKLFINLPHSLEQKVIANTLSTLDDKIELNNKINENLEEQAQAIFKHWFIDFEFPDENGNPYKSSGGEMIESELGMIPKEWKVNLLDEFIDRIDNRGKTPPYEKDKTEFPMLDVATLRGDSRIVEYGKVSKYVSEETYNNWFRNGHPKKNDILISTVGSLAEMKLFIGDIGCIAQNVVAMRSNNISPFYLYEYLKFIKNDLISYDIGTVQPSIKITHIIKHPLLLPKNGILKNFHVLAEKITDKIYLNHLSNQKLSQLRDTLLPRLMSGEIRIPLNN